MRLATFNILNGRVPGAEVDGALFAEVVRGLDADVLALQEVDRLQPRSGHADLTGIAAEAMGAEAWRFGAAMTGTAGSWRPASGREAAHSPAYGVALLSRHPVTAWREVRLPGSPVRVPYRFHGARRPTLVRDEARVALVATVATPAGSLHVACTHLSFLPMSNAVQLRRLVRALPDDGDLVLLGDLNMGPRAASVLTRMRPLASGRTFPAQAPTRQIDHVLARGSTLRTVGGGPVATAVSDHRALVAEVTMG